MILVKNFLFCKIGFPSTPVKNTVFSLSEVVSPRILLILNLAVGGYDLGWEVELFSWASIGTEGENDRLLSLAMRIT